MRLRAAVVAADNPAQLRKWLSNTVGGEVLQHLSAGRIALTHDALDSYGRSASVAHLRALLVSVDALPDEDRSIDRFDAFARELIGTVADSQDRKILSSWTRWQVLPRLRRRSADGASMAHSANNARRALRRNASFVEELHRRDGNLRTATQIDLDNWFGEGDATRWLSRPFLTWCQRRRHLPAALEIPSEAPRRPRAPIDVEQRWAIGRRLVIDDTLDIGDRVAAALVVLYGQPLARIASLTRTDLHCSSDGTIVLNLAGNPVPIHEPFATLIERLPTRRRNGVADQLDSPWLFPGSHAGRHIGGVVLGQRLRRLGIEPGLMRNAARSQLAAEIPSAMLGEIIGISPTTATRWTTHASGNWTAYAAEASST